MFIITTLLLSHIIVAFQSNSVYFDSYYLIWLRFWEFCLRESLRNLNLKNFNKKRTWTYWVITQKKKKSFTIFFYKFLNFELLHDSLLWVFIANVCSYNHFIILSISNIFIFKDPLKLFFSSCQHPPSPFFSLFSIKSFRTLKVLSAQPNLLHITKVLLLKLYSYNF